MTLNEKAFDKAAHAIEDLLLEPGRSHTPRKLAKAAIEAYEASLWSPINEAPKDGSSIIDQNGRVFHWAKSIQDFTYGQLDYRDDNLDYVPCSETSIITHFRPLPTFKEQE